MTDTTTQSLAEWLLDRIAEDEAAARAVCEHESSSHWETYALSDAGPNAWTMIGVGVPDDDKGHRVETMFPEDAAHIARHDPARVLAECAAKRRIVELEDDEAADSPPYYSALQDVLRALASVYADHAEFCEEWR